jgi:acetoacetyl-CoA synthetase
MSDIMWKPSPERAASSQMNRFRKMVNSKYGENLTNYSDLYEWSVRETPDFWEAMCPAHGGFAVAD